MDGIIDEALNKFGMQYRLIHAQILRLFSRMILNCPDKVLGVRSDSFLLVGLIQHYILAH
jgi:hypothetical protein